MIDLTNDTSITLVPLTFYFKYPTLVQFDYLHFVLTISFTPPLRKTPFPSLSRSKAQISECWCTHRANVPARSRCPTKPTRSASSARPASASTVRRNRPGSCRGHPPCSRRTETRRGWFRADLRPGTTAGSDRSVSPRRPLPGSLSKCMIFDSKLISKDNTCNTEGTVLCPCRVRPQPATVAILPTSLVCFGGKHTGRICCRKTTLRSNLT